MRERGTLLVRGAAVWTAGPRGILENSDVLVRDGRIALLGPGLRGEDCEELDGRGMVVTPGFIDVHTHVSLWEEGAPEAEGSGNEATNPVTPQLRVVDAINPRDRAFAEARAGGVTMVQILHGSANVVGGQGAVVRTLGDTVEDMLRLSPSGMKAAFGENPKNVYKGKNLWPSTRMAVAACLREALVGAGNYAAKAKAKNGVRERNLRDEALGAVLRREMPLRIHAHRADDILTGVRIAEEFGLDYTLEHCTEGFLIARVLAAKGARAAFGPAMTFRSKLELRESHIRHVVNLVRAGVSVALMTDHPVIPIGYLRNEAAETVREGLSEAEALGLVTRSAAAHLGLGARYGSLEEGKAGDLVLWSEPPFSTRAVAVATVVDGVVAHRA